MSLHSDPRRELRKLSPETILLDRVLLRATVDDAGCWIFGGATDAGGYGIIRKGSTNYRAHVVTFAANNGFEPSEHGLVVDHLCRVRACCNPEHLEAVTNWENVQGRGLHSTGFAIRTHCYLGHEMTAENTYVRPDGKGRQCRVCIKRRSEAQAAHRRTAKATRMD